MRVRVSRVVRGVGFGDCVVGRGFLWLEVRCSDLSVRLREEFNEVQVGCKLRLRISKCMVFVHSQAFFLYLRQISACSCRPEVKTFL